MENVTCNKITSHYVQTGQWTCNKYITRPQQKCLTHNKWIKYCIILKQESMRIFLFIKRDQIIYNPY